MVFMGRRDGSHAVSRSISSSKGDKPQSIILDVDVLDALSAGLIRYIYIDGRWERVLSVALRMNKCYIPVKEFKLMLKLFLPLASLVMPKGKGFINTPPLTNIQDFVILKLLRNKVHIAPQFLLSICFKDFRLKLSVFKQITVKNSQNASEVPKKPTPTMFEKKLEQFGIRLKLIKP